MLSTCVVFPVCTDIRRQVIRVDLGCLPVCLPGSEVCLSRDYAQALYASLGHALTVWAAHDDPLLIAEYMKGCC